MAGDNYYGRVALFYFMFVHSSVHPTIISCRWIGRTGSATTYLLDTISHMRVRPNVCQYTGRGLLCHRTSTSRLRDSTHCRRRHNRQMRRSTYWKLSRCKELDRLLLWNWDNSMLNVLLRVQVGLSNKRGVTYALRMAWKAGVRGGTEEASQPGKKVLIILMV